MRTDLLLLEDICVLSQAQLAEELRQVRAFERAVEVTAVASRQRGDAVHVIATAEIVLRCKAKERRAASVNTQRDHALIQNPSHPDISDFTVLWDRAAAVKIQPSFTEKLAFH